MVSDQIMTLTRQLLDAVADKDWETYKALCGDELTCFEPETEGKLVHGVEWHRQFFNQGGHLGEHQYRIEDPEVRMFGENSAYVCYRRVVTTEKETLTFLETRIWERIGNKWRHVHFHRTQI